VEGQEEAVRPKRKGERGGDNRGETHSGQSFDEKRNSAGGVAEEKVIKR